MIFIWIALVVLACIILAVVVPVVLFYAGKGPEFRQRHRRRRR